MNQTIEDLKSQKNQAIETLRALAVSLVFAHHLHSAAGITIPYFSEIGGWLGVQIFFVVSGYLIYLSAIRYSAKEYFKHRALRIYPAYLFWFLVFSFYFGQLTLEGLHWKALLAHFTFLQHFFPKYYFKYNALSVSWTLTIELMWYVIIFLCAAKFEKHPLKITCLFIFISYGWSYLGWSDGYYRSMDGGLRYFFVSNMVISQLPFFFFGAYIAVKNPKFDNAGLFAVFLVSVVLSLSWKPNFADPIFITGLGVAALFLILKSIKYQNARFVNLLSDISYSFYLIHYPVIVSVARVVEKKEWVVVLSFVITVVLAYLSYKFIEQPFIRMAKRRPAAAEQQKAGAASA